NSLTALLAWRIMARFRGGGSLRYWVALVLGAVLAGCQPAATRQSSSPAGSTVAPQKPLIILVGNEPRVLDAGLTSGTNSRDYAVLSNAFMAYVDGKDQPQPLLAEELPTVEKGTWKILPDGQME